MSKQFRGSVKHMDDLDNVHISKVECTRQYLAVLNRQFAMIDAIPAEDRAIRVDVPEDLVPLIIAVAERLGAQQNGHISTATTMSKNSLRPQPKHPEPRRTAKGTLLQRLPTLFPVTQTEVSRSAILLDIQTLLPSATTNAVAVAIGDLVRNGTLERVRPATYRRRVHA